jgi:hypothetical protein
LSEIPLNPPSKGGVLDISPLLKGGRGDLITVSAWLGDFSDTLLEQQTRRLKHNFVAAVLKALHPYVEPDTVPDNIAPVRAAYRYIHNRLEQLDYKGAIAAELPIGSGEIESAHRYVIQQRLKRSGSWWSVENAWAMLALRVLRQNQDWQSYWLDLAQNAA